DMATWLQRHITMRGRLAFLLVVLLVLPVVSAGWIGYRVLVAAHTGDEAAAPSDEAEVSAALHLDEAARAFRFALGSSLGDLALRLAHRAEAESGATGGSDAFAELPAAAQPACVVRLDSRGD